MDETMVQMDENGKNGRWIEMGKNGRIDGANGRKLTKKWLSRWIEMGKNEQIEGAIG